MKAKFVKLVYNGSLSGCTAPGVGFFKRGEPCEVPEAYAIAKVKMDGGKGDWTIVESVSKPVKKKKGVDN